MKSNFPQLYIVMLAFSLSATSFAQDESSHINTKVDIISMGETIPNLYLGNKKRKQVDALAFRYHTTLRYKGSPIIEIYQDQKNSDPDKQTDNTQGQKNTPKDIQQKAPRKPKIQALNIHAKAIANRRKKKPNLVALAKAPSGASHVTILLTPAENNTYITTVINSDPSKLPFGQMRVHNFCKHRISMRFNNDPSVVLPPNESYQTSPNNKQIISYLLAYPKKGKWLVQENNIIGVNKQEQVQMVILHSQSSFFQSSSGIRAGALQVAILRRNKKDPAPIPTSQPKGNEKPKLPNGLEEE